MPPPLPAIRPGGLPPKTVAGVIPRESKAPITFDPINEAGPIGRPDSGHVASGTNRLQPPAPEAELQASQESFTGTVAAGKTIVIPCGGSMFYFAEAAQALNVRLNFGGYVYYKARTGRRLFKGAFKWLEIQNTGAQDSTFTIVVGRDEYLDFRGGT